MKEHTNNPSGASWETFWKGVSSSEIPASSGFSHPGFTVFWSTALTEFIAANTERETSILDIASGSGAVVDTLSQLPGADLKTVSCVDVSQAAIDAVTKRFPSVTGVVSDAAQIPLESGRFDLVTSQFGIEYAGSAAIDEAVRLLAPGGSLLFLMHIQTGPLFNECSAAVDALRRVRDSGFTGLARTFFETGFAAVQGADREPYNRAAGALNPAVQELDAILSQYGEHVAGDTIVSLYDTVQKIHGRLQHYKPEEVFSWLDAMEDELPQHEARMASMLDAALDEEAFRSVCDQVTALGLTIRRAQASSVEGEEQPIAWVLQAERGT